MTPLNPTISVILPTHNRPELLKEAVESVLRQTFQDWELIIIDDASMPPVDLAALELPLDKVRLLRHPASRGGAAAKNTGIAAAKGNVVAFLDDDDLYAPAFLERAVTTLKQHPDIDVVFMGVEWFGSDAQWSRESYKSGMEKTLAEAAGVRAGSGFLIFGDPLVAALLNRVPMAFQRPVVRRSAFSNIGYYREDCLLWDCDWATWAALRTKTGLLDEPLYRQRVAHQGYSSKSDRQHEHLQSGINIRETLLTEAKRDANLARWQPLFRNATAKAWFDYAYERCEQYRFCASLSGWWKSQQYQLNMARFRLLVRITKRMVFARFPRRN